VKRVLALLALVAFGVIAWRLWPSDRRRIERRLDQLVAACEKSEPDTPLRLFSGTQTILDSFAPRFVVKAAPYGGTISDARELNGLIQRYRASARTVAIAVTDRAVEVSSHGTAEMRGVFRIRGDRGAGPDSESFRAQIFWVEEDGDWRIRELEVVEVLDRSGLFF